MSKRPWNTESAACLQIFCAALTGFCANDAFYSHQFQGDPSAAIKFADEVVLEAVYGDDKPTPGAS